MGDSTEATRGAVLQSGDRSAFESVIAEYYQPQLAYLMFHTRSVAEAEDLLQDLFLRLWRSQDTWRVTHGLRAYLYGAARNQLKNHHRSLARLDRAAESYAGNAVDDGLDAIPQAHAELEHAELVGLVREALDVLPARAREAWHLHHERGLTYGEVAEVMEVSVNTVKSQIARAVMLLRERLPPTF